MRYMCDTELVLCLIHLQNDENSGRMMTVRWVGDDEDYDTTVSQEAGQSVPYLVALHTKIDWRDFIQHTADNVVVKRTHRRLVAK